MLGAQPVFLSPFLSRYLDSPDSRQGVLSWRVISFPQVIIHARPAATTDIPLDALRFGAAGDRGGPWLVVERVIVEEVLHRSCHRGSWLIVFIVLVILVRINGAVWATTTTTTTTTMQRGLLCRNHRSL
jgi:hypothetical protein